MSEIIEKLETLLAPVLNEHHVELVDITYQKEHGGWTLCCYLDKPGGITLDDCETWSGRIGELIDQSNLIQQRYVLEVSSPGVNRPLKKLKDFHRFLGERVSVKLYAPQDGQKNFHGVLLGADDDAVRIQLEDQKRDVSLPRTQISKCKLDPIVDF